jgi:NAD(P)-dependent dehydrogenase (short-subunit alcohol dehydrogenase family)
MAKISDSSSSLSIFNLVGKVAIVTGGAGLLGAEIAEGLVAHGASVILVDIDDARGSKVVEQLKIRLSEQVSFMKCDLTVENDVINLVQKIISRFGKIDILVNNAAGKSNDLQKFFLPFEEYDVETWKKIIDLDLTSMFLVAREVGKCMVGQKTGGSIIQTSSIYGLIAPDQRIYRDSEYMGHSINSPAVYSAAKSGVVGLTKYLAAYWGKNGIRVNNLVPGGVFSGQNQNFVENYSARVPLGRMGNPSDVVGACIFLASDASSYITGQNLIVDGGLSCW